MSDLYISWQEYHRCIEKLAVTIDRSGWHFDTIVCVARGGLRVGDILSRLFKKPLAVISASSYGGENDRIRGEITLSPTLSMTVENLGPSVLLVDDLADSGVTLKNILNYLDKSYTICRIKTAVIWYKSSSIVEPDYYVSYHRDNPWIHQPFERYDRITPKDLG